MGVLREVQDPTLKILNSYLLTAELSGKELKYLEELMESLGDKKSINALISLASLYYDLINLFYGYYGNIVHRLEYESSYLRSYSKQDLALSLSFFEQELEEQKKTEKIISEMENKSIGIHKIALIFGISMPVLELGFQELKQDSMIFNLINKINDASPNVPPTIIAAMGINFLLIFLSSSIMFSIKQYSLIYERKNIKKTLKELKRL